MSYSLNRLSYLPNCMSMSFIWTTLCSLFSVSSNTNETQLCDAGYCDSLVCCIVLSCWCNSSFWEGHFFLQKILRTALWEISTRDGIRFSVLGAKCYISGHHVLAPGILLILCIVLLCVSSVYSEVSAHHRIYIGRFFRYVSNRNHTAKTDGNVGTPVNSRSVAFPRYYYSLEAFNDAKSVSQ